MHSNITSLRTEEKVRFLILKHRGNAVVIAEESGLPLDYVRRIIRKVKRSKKNSDVDYHIGTTMAQYIMDGSEQRKAYLLEELRKESSKPRENLSLCCNKPVNEYMWEKEPHYTCKKCGKDCEIKNVDVRNMDLIIRLLEQLKGEDASLVEFLARIGFVQKMMDGSFDSQQPESQGRKKTRNRVVENGSDLDKSLVEDVDNMDPRTRETLRKNLEQKIIDQGFVDDGQQ